MTWTARPGGAMGWRAMQLVGIQLVFFVRLLVLARLLEPAAFGLLAIAMVALAVMLRVSDVGMLPALVQKQDATPQDYDVAWTAGVLRAALVAGVLVAGAPLLAPLFGEPRAAPIIQALAARPLIEACASIGVARLTRELRFRELALIQVPGAVADTIVAVATAPVLGVWALVAGSLAGAATTTALSYRYAPHRPRLDFAFRAAAPLVRYGRWVLLTGIVALAGSSATQLILSRELGVTALGLYFLAARLAFLPSDMTSAVVGAVAFPLYARHAQDAPRSGATFRALLSGQAIVLLPLYAVVIVLAPGMSELLGARWAGTAPVVQVLAVACMLGIFGEALTPLLMGRGRSDRVLVLELIQTGVLLAVVWPLVQRFGVVGAAMAWLLANAAAQVAAAVLAQQTHPGIATGLSRSLAAAAGAAATSGLSAAAVRTVAPGAAGLIAATLVGLATGLLAAWILYRRQERSLAELLPWSPRWAATSGAGAPQ